MTEDDPLDAVSIGVEYGIYMKYSGVIYGIWTGISLYTVLSEAMWRLPLFLAVYIAATLVNCWCRGSWHRNGDIKSDARRPATKIKEIL